MIEKVWNTNYGPNQFFTEKFNFLNANEILRVKNVFQENFSDLLHWQQKECRRTKTSEKKTTLSDFIASKRLH